MLFVVVLQLCRDRCLLVTCFVGLIERKGLFVVELVLLLLPCPFHREFGYAEETVLRTPVVVELRPLIQGRLAASDFVFRIVLRRLFGVEQLRYHLLLSDFAFQTEPKTVLAVEQQQNVYPYSQ